MPAGERIQGSAKAGAGRARVAVESVRAVLIPKTEGRRPKEARRPKSESTATPMEQRTIGSGIPRISGFGLLSGLGFWPSDFKAASLVGIPSGRTSDGPCGRGLALTVSLRLPTVRACRDDLAY